MKKMDLDLIFQTCICTDDMNRVLSNWRQLFELEEDSIIYKNTKDIFDRGEYHGCNYNEEPCEFFHKYYRLNMGHMDLEMIEPISKDISNPYTDFLARNGSGIHHLGSKFRDRSVLVDDMKEMGIKICNYGFMGPKDQPVETRPDCYFYDLRDQLGVTFEAGLAVVGPLASDKRSGDNSTATQLNSFANKPELPEIEPLEGLNKIKVDQVFQLCICAQDCEAVVANWTNWFNLDPGKVYRWEDVEYKLCRLEIGGIDIAVVEPINKAAGTPFADYLIENKGNGIHHISMQVSNYDDVVYNMKKLGYRRLANVQTAVSKHVKDVRSITYDLRDRLGVIIEFTDNSVGVLSRNPRY